MKDSVGFRLPWGLGPFLAWALLVSTMTGVGVYHVWHQYRVIELGRELSEESTKYTELNNVQRKLRLELAAVKRIDAIRTLAESRFDMKIPERSDYIVVTK